MASACRSEETEDRGEAGELRRGLAWAGAGGEGRTGRSPCGGCVRMLQSRALFRNPVSGSNSSWSLLNLQGISGVQISIMYAFYLPWCLSDFEESLEQLLHFQG